MHQGSALEQAVEYIHANWKEGKTLKEIAELHHLDPGNLERSFRNRHGMTVKQFVDVQRKEYVISTLNDKLILGYEIGSDLGFKDDLAFYRWVKRAFGKSYISLRAQRSSEQTTIKSDKKR